MPLPGSLSALVAGEFESTRFWPVGSEDYLANGLDASPDPQGVWTDEANAVDGSVSTFAFTSSAGSAANNYAQFEITGIPGTAPSGYHKRIWGVLVRAHLSSNVGNTTYGLALQTSANGQFGTSVTDGNATTTPAWTSWYGMAARDPSGGFLDWSSISSGLGVKVWKGSGSDLRVHQVEIRVLIDRADALYAFDKSSTANNLAVLKSTDGGQTWTEQDSSNRPTFTALEEVDSVLDGPAILIGATSNYVAPVGMTSGSLDVHATHFDITTDTWGAAPTLIETTVLDAAQTNHRIVLGEDRGSTNTVSTARAFYAADTFANMGSDYHSVSHVSILLSATYTRSVGTPAAATPNNTADDYALWRLTAVGTGAETLFAFDGAGGLQYGNSFTNALQTEVQLGSIASSVRTRYENAFLWLADPTNNTLNRYAVASNNWAASAGEDTSPHTSGTADGPPIPSYDAINDDLYVAITDGDLIDQVVSLSADGADGSVWQAPVNIYDVADGFQWRVLDAKVFYHPGGSLVLGVVAGRAGGGASSIYHEYVIDAGSSGGTVTHTTDAVLYSVVTKTHTTDATLVAVTTASHTTDAVLLLQPTVQHTTDALLLETTTVTHTTDALLFVTASETHSTDAHLVVEVTASHSTDAVLVSVVDVTHTTDAVAVSVVDATHTTDALLLATVDAAHTTDAFLLASTAVTHTSDALLLATVDVVHTTDAVLVDRLTLAHTTDAVLLVVPEVTHTTDAVLVAQPTVTHTADALLNATVAITHTADAHLVVVGSATHTSDAFLVARPTVTHTADAMAVDRLDVTHTSDAFLLATIDLTHTSDAFLEGTGTAVHTTDAVLLATVDLTHTTDAILTSAQSVVHTADAYLLATIDAVHSTDALLVDRLATTHTTDALLQATVEATHLADAFLVDRIEVAHTSDAVLLDVVTTTHTTDAFLEAQGSVTHTSDAVLLATVTTSHTTDAVLNAIVDVSHTSDAFLIVRTTLIHATDAVLVLVIGRPHNTDAVLVDRLTVTHSTDAFLANAASVTHTSDAYLQGVVSVTHRTDAHIVSDLVDDYQGVRSFGKISRTYDPTNRRTFRDP